MSAVMHVDDDVAATGGGYRKKRRKVRGEQASSSTAGSAPYLPHEIVVDILARLPVQSLLRFRSVCKAWRSVISDDASFVRAHLQHQPRRPSSLLLLPLPECERPSPYEDHHRSAERKEKRGCSSRMAFYRWTPPPAGELGDQGAVLVHAVDEDDDDDPSLPPEERRCVPHDALAHCDGLVLVPTGDGKVHLFNPGTRQAVTLPWSPGSDAPPGFPRHRHQAFGLGRDPRSGAYKVARYFHREVFVVATGTRQLTTGMELYTVGTTTTDRRWREARTQPTHPVVAGRTATFVNGCLLWPIDDSYLAPEDAAAPDGFLRFSLEDETFGITPAPPACHRRSWLDGAADDSYSRLSELHGELCVARMVPDTDVLELWMSEDAVHPRWERRYAIRWWRYPPLPRPVAMFHDGIVFRHHVGPSDIQIRSFDNIARTYSLRFRSHSAGDGFHVASDGNPTPTFSNFFVIPYHESLIILV